MTPTELVYAYNAAVYDRGDAEAARRFIADPCLRHEHGQLVRMTLDENVARIAHFLDAFEGARFVNALLLADGEHVVSCWNASTSDGRELSGIEVFRVVDDKIVETWNSKVGEGLWG